MSSANFLSDIGSTLGVIPARAPIMTGGVDLDWSHPLAMGMRACVVTDGVRTWDIATPRIVGTPWQSPTPPALGPGVECYCGSSSDADIQFTSGPWSLAARAYFRQNASDSPLIFGHNIFNSSTNNQGWNLIILSGSEVGAQIMANNSSYTFTGPSISTGTELDVVFTSDGSTTLTLYVWTSAGSYSVTTATSGVNFNPVTVANVMTLGSAQLNDVQGGIGCAWSRALSSAEAKLFHSDPYGMVRSRSGLLMTVPPWLSPSSAYFSWQR